LGLIRFCLARATREGASRREAPATRAAGRPPGIPNPRRRAPDLVARPLSPKTLSHLIARKPSVTAAREAALAAARSHRSGRASRA
jgi:hypothetical protein